ncbi:NKAP domain containing 1 [Cololabis saira]|uniref:NKAP domain containing 1 n=1 Tax=Cololabis saira TaxID=129043 RepID=UPI002AD4C1C1|nr:NKAP domain containing 1 [Cololabis saira]
MSKQPLGKTLLRNVIRHTDAHNKIQEEMEMWKMRGWEMQTSHPKHTLDTDSLRGHMHCDRVSDQSRDTSQSRERGSEHNDKEARYWTRKLYEFEAGDPDRWGHSGFKELYPEDFESGGEELGDLTKSGHHKTKKSKSVKEPSLSKRSKKSSRKKKKKKSKKSESKKLKKDESSSSELCSDDSSAAKDKQKKRKRTKSRHKNKKTSKTRERDEDSSSGDGKVEERRVKRNHRCKKRKQDSHTDSDSGAYSRKKRKDWKAAGEENSADTSAD